MNRSYHPLNAFTIKGRTCRYLDKGEGDVLLFGHSYLFDHSMWAPQIELLSKSYRCIAPDLWGHGASDIAPDSSTTIADYARDMLALMDHLSIQTFSIIGLSVGGMWGAELALEHPERIRHLTLMDTFLGDEPEETKALYFSMLDSIDQDGKVTEPLLQTLAPIFFCEKTLKEQPRHQAAFNERLSQLEGERLTAVTRVGRMIFNRRDALADLENIRCNTLILTGEHDKPRPVEESRLMEARIPTNSLHIIRNAGHISSLENPEEVNRRLTAFLADSDRKKR